MQTGRVNIQKSIIHYLNFVNMRLKLNFLVIALSFLVSAVQAQYVPFGQYGNSAKRFKADSVLHIPVRSTNDTALRTTDTSAQIALIGGVLKYHSGYWRTLSGGGSWEQLPGQNDIACAVLSTVDSLALYTGIGKNILVTDANKGGLFYYTQDANTIDNVMVFAATGKGGGYFVRRFDKAQPLNPLWFGLSTDSTVDNAPLLNAVLAFGARYGIPVVLNDTNKYGIKTPVTIPQRCSFTICAGVTITNYAPDSIAMFLPKDSSTFIMRGIGYLNKRKGVVVYLDGHTNKYATADSHWEINALGNNMAGQVGVKMLADGMGIYGSAPISYINDFVISAHNLDYLLYAEAINHGNINNLRILMDAGNTINGVYLYSDTTKIYPAGTGKTTIAFFNMSGNIRVGAATRSLMTLKGISECNFYHLKLEDYGRYLDTIGRAAAIYLDGATANNRFDLYAFKPQYINDQGLGNIINCHTGTGTNSAQDISPQNLSIYPNGTISRFAGGFQSDYLLGSGSVWGASNGYKPGIKVTTTSNTTDSLYKMFIEDVGSFDNNVNISDADSVEKTIKIAIDHVIHGNTIGVEFGGTKYAPRYCRVEAYSQDSARKYTIIETADNWNGTNLIGIFAGKLIKKTLKSFQLGGNTITDTSYIQAYLDNVDTLYITVKGNNTGEGATKIAINRIWLYVNDENAKNVVTASGNTNNVFYSNMQARGTFDFYKDIDLHNDSIRNAFYIGAMQSFGPINNMDTNYLFPGFYSFNASTRGTLPGGTNIGSVEVAIISSLKVWDNTTNSGPGLTMKAIDNAGNVFFRGFNSTSHTWSSWVQAFTPTIASPIAGQVLAYNGTIWANYTPTKIPLGTSINGTTVNASTTTYHSINAGITTAFSTEINRSFLFATSGTLGNLYISTSGTQSATGSMVCTLRKNGVATGIKVTIAAGATATQYSDLTHTVSISPGDTVSLQFVNNATAASLAVYGVSISFY